MLRKIAFGFIAAASLGIAALAPTSASAWHGGWHGHHHHHGFFHHGFRPHVFIGGGYGGCYVRRLVATPYGYRYRLVNRCY